MKPNKYRAKRTEYNGVTYASKAEALRAAELDLLVQSGELTVWCGQPTYELGCPENVYRADFYVDDGKGNVWTEDVKGCETPKFRHDKKLWRRYGKHPLHILKRKGSRWVVEVVEPETKGGAK